MAISMTILTVLTVLFLLAVMIIDYKSHMIPNKLTIPVLVAGLVIAGVNGVIVPHVLAALLGFGLLLVPFMLGWVGGGDVKFLAALGALAGFQVLIYSALFGLVIAGLISVVRLYRRGKLRGVFSGLILAWYTRSTPGAQASGDFIPLGTCMGVAGVLFIMAKALGW